MSKVAAFERSMIDRLEALVAEVSLGLSLIDDMLSPERIIRLGTFKRVCQRLQFWHWHPALSALTPRVRFTAGRMHTAWEVATTQWPEHDLSNERVRETLTKCRDDIDAFRLDLVAWVYEAKAGRTPNFTPRAPARVSGARV